MAYPRDYIIPGLEKLHSSTWSGTARSEILLRDLNNIVKPLPEAMATYQPAILSASLGRAWHHEIHHKLNQAAADGFKGVEIFYEDLEYDAKRLFKTEAPTPEQLTQTAAGIHKTCQSAGLEVISLQPFLFYDGLLDRAEHDRLIEKIHVWFKIARELKTTTIQIPANFLPAEKLTGDFNVIADDLRQLADLGLKEEPQVKFAYENLCWSTHVDTWEKAWQICKMVDRPNFGLCLDTFNIAGRVWADPASPDGKTPNADADLQASLEAMVREVDLAKVFFIQVVDAERLAAPLVEGHPYHVDGQPARMSWSRNARAFIYEEERGGYLPVEAVTRTLINDMGYKGFVSMELFSRTMSEEGNDVPKEHSQRGIRSWTKLQKRLQLESR
ncbi:hypothetical protein FJTKL_07610 [Diaporthe vaccinii]|uniref:Xylose isomerase-like TIM barrel domain-containing protein n=1 Tax=Diaporthe vaccinii TaxID=105482 RepID=A0ABR4ET35_9PEZI